MAAPETADLRALPEAELLKELDEGHRALFNLRFQAATRQLADVSQVRSARRRIARIKTLVRERQILEEHGVLLEGGETPPPASVAEEAPSEEAPAAEEPAAEPADDEAAEAEQPEDPDDEAAEAEQPEDAEVVAESAAEDDEAGEAEQERE